MPKGSRTPVWLAVGAIALVPLAAGGCGDDDDNGDETTGASTQAAASGPGGTIDVSETDFKLTPADPTVKPGKVTINVSNDGQVVHSLEVEGPSGESELEQDLQPGEKGTLTADLPPGTYEWYCPVGDHKGKGMEGEITVK